MSKTLRKKYTHYFYKNNIGQLSITAVMMILLSFFNLAVSYLLQKIIDISTGNEIGELIIICWWCLGVFCAFIIVFSIQRFTFAKFLYRAKTQYKEYVFSEIARKSISSFMGENTSKYISALTNDIASIETNYLSKIFSLIMDSVSFVGAIILMLYYSPLLTIVALALSLFSIAISLLFSNRLVEAEKNVSKQNESFISLVKDILSGFSIVKSFKAEGEILAIFKKNNDDIETAKYHRRIAEGLINMLAASAGIIAQIGVFLFGAYLAITGTAVTPGIVIVFLQLMNFVVEPIGTFPQIIANRKAALALVDKLANSTQQNVRRKGKKIDKIIKSGIVIKNLTFSYEKEKPVLKKVSVKFTKGKSYAIVGGSGSGKSTLLNLVMGSREDYEGDIYFDNYELRTIAEDSLYDLVSIVEQNVFIFNNSILDNITMFRDFERAKVDRAINMSGLSDLVLERGIDYCCGENGVGLSGGERQRISIARCLLRETPILLVDEATASLDLLTASAVTNSILDIDGVTRVLVTHRLEEDLLKRFNEIIVLRSGSICEVGKFDELMDNKGYFYSLFKVSEIV